MITTTSTDARFWGSNIYAPVLVAYLREVCRMGCEFHYGPELELPLDDDAEVFTRTLARTRYALAAAHRLGLAEAGATAEGAASAL